jgi:hypothetical protein
MRGTKEGIVHLFSGIGVTKRKCSTCQVSVCYWLEGPFILSMNVCLQSKLEQDPIIPMDHYAVKISTKYIFVIIVIMFISFE